MKVHAVYMGVLFLVLATIFHVSASAQEAKQPLEPIAASANGFDQGGCASDAIGDKTCCVSTCCACPRTYGYAEILFLERDNSSYRQPLLVETVQGNPGAPLFSTSDLDFDFDPALRIVVGRRLCNGWAIEGGYFGLCDASTAELVAPAAGTNVAFPGGLVASNVFGDPDRVWNDYSSSLHSGELNLVHCCGCCSTCESGKGDDGCKDDCGGCNLSCRTCEWFVGFRYFNLRERLRVYGERDQTTGGATTAVESGVYDIRTSNNLYGPQAGARVRRWGQRLGWEAGAKAGIFGIDAQQEQSIIDYDRFPLRPLTSASDDQVAFVGELSLTGIYRLNHVWNLRAGYNLIWIEGVALAPDQLDFDATLPSGDRLSSDGSIFLHGVSLGVEGRW